jgi:hypothetical protein
MFVFGFHLPYHFAALVFDCGQFVDMIICICCS